MCPGIMLYSLHTLSYLILTPVSCVGGLIPILQLRTWIQRRQALVTSKGSSQGFVLRPI